MTPKSPYSNHNESVAWIAGFQCGHGAREQEVEQLRQALQAIAEYDPGELQADFCDMQYIAKQALASTQPKESK